MRIRQLPPLIANQIAAGEVIERPASVVKELLENSLDAGATAITIEISYGGLNQIKISDNGVGIVAEDLPLAIAPNATSKINSLDDLYSIDSMGFRGEALASIVSVAKVSISSKTAQQETALMLQVLGSETTCSPCARTVGTTVDVVDLFFNAPVRKRFLKTEKLEFQAIETVVKRFALSAPGVALLLKHNGKQVLSLPVVTSEQSQLLRLTRIFGSAFVKEAIYLDVDHDSMKLQGWISSTRFQRSQSDRLWVYINQRMVKDKLIHQALKQAYDGLLHPGRFPACVLYFTINHAEVDVNVHPTKHEVRFQQPRLIFDFFTSQLSAALNTKKEAQKFVGDFDRPKSFAQEIYEPYPQLTPVQEGLHTYDLPWVSLNNQYILVFIHQQPYIVNLLTLQQYKIQQQLSELTFPLASRPLLVPIQYTLSPQLAISIPNLIQSFNQLGMQIEDLGNQEIVIRSIPVCLPYLDLRLFLETLTDLESFHSSQLIKLMSNSQVFDPRLFSVEEKKELNELLLNIHGANDRTAGLFKALTHEDCRNLLDV